MISRKIHVFNSFMYTTRAYLETAKDDDLDPMGVSMIFIRNL